jgi:hypothetical protein
VSPGPPFDATPLLRRLAARRIAALRQLDPAATQAVLLRRLLRDAAGTRFGREHGFDRIDTVAAFQAHVPLRRYEDFWDGYWRAAFPDLRDVTVAGPVPYLALSSGTSSGRTKYLPVTRAMVRANRDAAFDTLAWNLAAHPRSRPLAGLAFMLGGSTALEAPTSGVRMGDLSGIAAAEVPWLLRSWSFPPARLALLADWDAKLDALVDAAPHDRVRVLTGTPSWLLLLLERLAARHGPKPLPALELLIHGGVAWAPYRDRFAAFLPEGCATREVYPASEGFVAIADRGDGEGLRLNLDRGCFFEFVPVAELDAANPTRHWVGTVETGVDYAVAISSVAGLWAYLLGDTVRFVDRAPPRLLVTGRTGDTLNAFGEHVTGGEVAAAIAACGIAVAEYMVGPVFGEVRGHHLWLIEAATAAPDAVAAVAARLDQALRAANADYAAHRSGRQLDGPEIVILPPGGFAAWLRAAGKLGGQHKIPRVIADPARFAEVAATLRHLITAERHNF